MSKFKVGDTVVVSAMAMPKGQEAASKLAGMRGTVRGLKVFGTYNGWWCAVDFGRQLHFSFLHNCDGNVRSGKGFWIIDSALDLVNGAEKQTTVKLSSGHEIVATSKDTAKIGCTVVTREDARVVLAAMDAYSEAPKFKIGDYVKVVSAPRNFGESSIIGKCGKIVGKCSSELFAEEWEWDVEFAEKIYGAKHNHIVYMDSGDLELNN